VKEGVLRNYMILPEGVKKRLEEMMREFEERK